MLYLSAAHNSLFYNACLAPVASQTRTGQRGQGLCLPRSCSQIRCFTAQPGQCGDHCMGTSFSHPCPSSPWRSRALHRRGCGDFSGVTAAERGRSLLSCTNTTSRAQRAERSHNFHTTYLPCSNPDKYFRGGRKEGGGNRIF